MNYIPCVAWGLCPGGTAKQIANYFGSWGLLGDAPAVTGFNAYVLVSGAWKQITDAYVLISNTWKTITNFYCTISSAWKNI